MSRHFRFKGSDLPLSAEKENGKMIPSPTARRSYHTFFVS